MFQLPTGVADACVVNLNTNFMGLWRLHFNVFYREIFACFPCHGGLED